MTARLLCLNLGSSSLKFSVFEGEQRQRHGTIDEVGPSALARALDATADAPVDAVVHRLVCGAPDSEPGRIDETLLAQLRASVPLAPLHLPAAIAAIEQVARQHPGMPQVACFDTSFHRTLPAVARRLPIPEHLHTDGLSRRGFHGLSCEHVVATLGAALPPRTVVAHLGQGASLTAIRDGRSVDTTMGLTPTGGIPMGTRTGDLDPGLLVHLLRHRGLSLEALDRLVTHEGGLLAVGGSSSMVTLLDRRAHDARAALAVDLFVMSVRKAIGALTAVLGGLDLLVFTGGIGEHAAPVRAEVCAGLGFLGLHLDPTRNEHHDERLEAEGGSVSIRRVVAEEDRVMARHARRCLG